MKSVSDILDDCMHTGYIHHKYCIYGFDSIELNEEGEETILSMCHFDNSECALLKCCNCKYYRLDVSKTMINK